MKPFDRDLFEKAFAAGGSSCRHTCKCGRVFWDSENAYTWEIGEFEELEADKNATRLPYAVSILELEGGRYAMDCDCWIERAKKVAEWLANNDRQIARWLNLRKKQAIAQAQALPEASK